MSSEISALEELKGRCLAISVAYLDTGIRMRPAIECITKHLNDAVRGPITHEAAQELSEEILNLREYLKIIQKHYPEVKREFEPTIKVCSYLVDPINPD